MHLFFLTRGMKNYRDLFVESLANMWLPMKLKDKHGKETTKVVQGLLQPIEMWSFVFPEENLDKVLRTIKPAQKIGTSSFSCPSPRRELSLLALRKFLGLKKIPDWDENGPRFPIRHENMQVAGIGIKKDYRNKWGNECL